jgi:fatty-acyl-CoA synthase
MSLLGLMQPTPLTIRMIFDRMRTVHGGSRVHAIDGDRSYAEVAERVLRLCRVLTEELAVKPGDRVATFGFNTAAHLELYYAVPLVGAVLHTVNVRLYDEQVSYIIDHAGDEVVFVDAEVLGLLAAAIPATPRVRHHVVLGEVGIDVDLDAFASLHRFEDLLAGVDPLDPALLPDVDENAAAGLCYTSGTTGMPKGVLYSHRAQVLHAMSANMASVLGLTEHDVVFPVVPMFHAFAWGLPYIAPFVGADLVLHGSDSSPATLARLIAEHRVTVTAGVPTIWKSLTAGIEDGSVDMSSVRQVGVGGSASPRSLIEFFESRGIEYLQIWGMTETGPLATVSRPRRGQDVTQLQAVLDAKERTGTVTPGLELRIVGEDGQVQPNDGVAVGEIEVRGPWIASAYYDPARASRGEVDVCDRFHDGWLRTGDVATMEPDHSFRIVDRTKDLVKSGGEWISSVELEGELLAHPAVTDVAVIGLPHPRWDERPVAVIVASDPAVPPTLGDVHAFLDGRVARWWFPDAIALVDEIAKTSVGKIDKKLLRASIADQITLG